ncbi:MAG: hypothetical protein LBH07_04790, partial [Treponema sp.]|nr:hypothetical protein [Treponema sp.]
TIGGIRKTEIGANNIEVAYWEDIGKALKSKNTWRNYYGEPGYGPDVLNFSAMPGGDNGPNYGDAYPENHGRWWTATESSAGTRWIYSMLLQYNTDDLYEMALSKDWGLSVRAVRDTAPASVQVPEDRSDFALTHFSVKNTTINRNEEYEILFRLKNTMNWRSFNVYAMVDFLDKDGKRAARFGGADIDSFLAGGEDNLRAINIYRVQTPQGDMPPGQYQLRMVIEYWLNGVRTEKPITQVLPGVPAALNVTVSTVPVIRRSGGER